MGPMNARRISPWLLTLFVAPLVASAIPANRFECPTEKPQKVYGWAMNAKAVLEKPETWTPDHVYLIFGPLSITKGLTIQAGTVVCFDYGPAGADGSAAPPPGNI